jgi:hypothetical protein
METKVRYVEDVELGNEIGPVEVDISDDSVLAFCKVWGNEMPNRFTDPELAKKVGLSGPIVPGIMSMAIMARLFGDWSPSAVLKNLDVVFRQPVGHEIVSINAVITDIPEPSPTNEHLIECDIYLTGSSSDRLVGGKAIVVLPSRST